MALVPYGLASVDVAGAVLDLSLPPKGTEGVSHRHNVAFLYANVFLLLANLPTKHVTVPALTSPCLLPFISWPTLKKEHRTGT